MLELYRTKRFKKMLKKYKGKKNVLAELEYIVELLLTEQDIPAKYRDHALTGNYQGIRELHLKPDDLLLYVKVVETSVTLFAIGSHAELFG